MAGKIIADQIQHSTAGSLDTQYVVNGSAKAWVNFNGTGTIAARDSLNLSGLTDLGTGNYRITFANAFGDGDYSYAGVGRDGGTTASCVSLQSGTTPPRGPRPSQKRNCAGSDPRQNSRQRFDLNRFPVPPLLR